MSVLPNQNQYIYIYIMEFQSIWWLLIYSSVLALKSRKIAPKRTHQSHSHTENAQLAKIKARNFNEHFFPTAKTQLSTVRGEWNSREILLVCVYSLKCMVLTQHVILTAWWCSKSVFCYFGWAIFRWIFSNAFVCNDSPCSRAGIFYDVFYLHFLSALNVP